MVSEKFMGLGEQEVLEEVYQELYEAGRTDGLPVVPPTEERVRRMIQVCGLPPMAHLGQIPPAGGRATVEKVARDITAAVSAVTIGIGASPACDGQVLVTEDLVGLFGDFTPKFVKRYAELGAEIKKAAQAYAEDVRARRFPGPEHCFGSKSLSE